MSFFVSLDSCQSSSIGCYFASSVGIIHAEWAYFYDKLERPDEAGGASDHDAFCMSMLKVPRIDSSDISLISCSSSLTSGSSSSSTVKDSDPKYETVPNKYPWMVARFLSFVELCRCDEPPYKPTVVAFPPVKYQYIKWITFGVFLYTVENV